LKLPRHAELWLPGYLGNRFARLTRPASGPKRVWLAIADHYEPLGRQMDEDAAIGRVGVWAKQWPLIAVRHQDSAGRAPKYTFFYPQEEYRARLLDPLAEMTHTGIGDVEVHIHHDGEGQQNFLDRMSGFQETLFHQHGLLRRHEGKIGFGFIHGNWALDNSLPGGKFCGLNNEITLLQELGCYADFTMPCGASPAQAHTVNTIYWAIDDPARPKSYDYGVPLKPGGTSNGLLMIPGPLGMRWAERLVPRLEKGEIGAHDMPNRYRVRRWLDLSPRVGSDIFVKLYTHGCQERHSTALLLNGGLDALFAGLKAECDSRGWPFYYASCWDMYQAVDAIRRGEDPVSTLAARQESVGIEKN
jgi:hypothetical protein